MITLTLHLISEERAALRAFLIAAMPPRELLTNDLAQATQKTAAALEGAGGSPTLKLEASEALALTGWLTTLPLTAVEEPPGSCFHLHRALIYLLSVLRGQLTYRGLLPPPVYARRDRAEDGAFDPLEQGRV